jgi:serine/threonine-protein kinase PpkA
VFDFPGYNVIGEIGRGGMAIVYRARQVLLDREVALKVLIPSLSQDPVYAQRFLQEARMLASLSHPNIVAVYDVGVTSRCT